MEDKKQKEQELIQRINDKCSTHYKLLLEKYNITDVFYEKIKEALSDVYIELEPNKLFIELITLEETTQKRQLDIVVQLNFIINKLVLLKLKLREW